MLRFVALLALAVAVVASPQGISNKAYHHETVRGAKVHHQGDIVREEPVIPEEFVTAHNTFTLDVLKHQLISQVVEKHGAVSVSPFGLAHFLALVNEKTFNVPTQSISKVLRLPVERVAEAYGVIAEAHADDHKAYLTSELYTPNENVVVTPALNRLGLHKQNLLFANQAPAIINHHVETATHDLIVDALVPNVPVLNKDTTKAVFLNTFLYRNYFEYEFLKVGKKPFQTPVKTIDAETLEVIGTFPVYENEMFSAVALPLESEGEDKHVVFVLPKTTLKQYLTSEAIEYVFKTVPTKWVKKTVRVQVPHVNITLAHNVDQLVNVETVVCTKDQTEQVHPIVQVTNFVIDNEEISYAVTTGAQITTTKTAGTVAKTQRNAVHNHQYKLDVVVPTHHNDLVATEVILNKPFFTYFYDTTYGPFGYTAISHVLTKNDYVRSTASPFDFTEEAKNARFTCEGLRV